MGSLPIHFNPPKNFWIVRCSFSNYQRYDNNYNQEVWGGGAGVSAVGRKVKNVPKGKKSKILAKSKKSTQAKKPDADFEKAKANEASGIDFLTSEARVAFIRLWKPITEALILRHFDLECHIRIETDASGYSIWTILSQLTLDPSYSDHGTSENPNHDPKFSELEISQRHPLGFFSWKMIPAETRYETHYQKLLDIVEAFKARRHYLESCKYKVLILTDNNNQCRFLDTKSLSSKQVRCT